MTPKRAKQEVMRRPDSLPQRPYEINTLFQHFFDEFQLRSTPIELPGFWVPKIDIYETHSTVILEIEIPGMAPNDFSFSVDGDLIRIKGEKRRDIQEKESGFRRIERSYGLFERILRLPAEVSEQKFESIYQDGILKIALTKKKIEEEQQSS
jgi:HSP20 family protein